MPYKLFWKQYGHLVMVEFSGVITIAELEAEFDEALNLINSVDTPLVHMIVDTRGVTDYPKNIAEYRHIFDQKAQSEGWTIMVTGNRMLKFIGAVVTNFTSTRFATVDDLDEALQFLAARDALIKLDDMDTKQV